MTLDMLFRTRYSEALVEHIAHAKHSVTLATMVIDTNIPMDTVFNELQGALKRHVKVTLYIDVFTRLGFYEGAAPHKAYRQHTRLLHRLSQLTQQGANIIWLGKLGVNPYKRRFHQKVSIIDDKTVFFAGGINLTGESFHHHDLMIHAEHTKLAAILNSQLNRIATEQYINDETHALDPSNTLLIDGGQPYSSIIYDTVLQYAAKAKEIIYVSQMAPSGKLAHILTRKPTTLYLNTPTSMSLLGGTSELITQKRHRYVNTYRDKRYIHAKYILFILPGGEKVAITGSHNFNERGVNYGTKEIALLTKDEDVWNALYDYTQKELTS